MYRITSDTVSESFGSISMICWIFAQMPQVWQNYRLESVEGLAFPFLLSWLAGDTTNLVGCILTNQLPFQRNLAIYFCIVDVMLTAQYIWYSRKYPSPPLPALYTPVSLGGETVEEHWRRNTGLSTPAHLPSLSSFQQQYTRSVSGTRDGQSTSRSSASRPYARTRPSSEDGDGDGDGDGGGDLMQSSMVSFAPQHMISSTIMAEPSPIEHKRSRERSSPGVSLVRGRALARSVPILLPPPQSTSSCRDTTPTTATTATTTTNTSAGVRSLSRPSRTRDRQGSRRKYRTSSTMILLAGFTLVSVGRMGIGSRRHAESSGTVQAWNLADSATLMNIGHDPSGLESSAENVVLPITSSDLLVQLVSPFQEVDDDHNHNDNKDHHTIEQLLINTTNPEKSTIEYTIGRISAWLCACFYLTSRLPQIWKNFRRKSVEGLSMFLFVMAALGNIFYVLSILTSPALQQHHDQSDGDGLMESVPYLLGSGGTLCFDFTIVAQSWIYNLKKRRLHHHHHHRHHHQQSSRSPNQSKKKGKQYVRMTRSSSPSRMCNKARTKTRRAEDLEEPELEEGAALLLHKDDDDGDGDGDNYEDNECQDAGGVRSSSSHRGRKLSIHRQQQPSHQVKRNASLPAELIPSTTSSASSSSLKSLSQ